MHVAQRKFLETVYDFHKDHFLKANVCEFGSFNVNGSIRPLLPGWKLWVGIDLNVPTCWGGGKPTVDGEHPCDCGPRQPETQDFPCVQMIGDTSNTTLPDQSFDVVISSNHLEHDPGWVQSIEEAHRLLVPQGLFVLSTVTPLVAEHELWTTGHYNKFTAFEVKKVLEMAGFDPMRTIWHEDRPDVEDIQVVVQKNPQEVENE